MTKGHWVAEFPEDSTDIYLRVSLADTRICISRCQVNRCGGLLNLWEGNKLKCPSPTPHPKKVNVHGGCRPKWVWKGLMWYPTIDKKISVQKWCFLFDSSQIINQLNLFSDIRLKRRFGYCRKSMVWAKTLSSHRGWQNMML